MPEYPDIVVYLECLERRIIGREMTGVRIAHPFLLRTAEPAPASVAGRRVRELRRLGKRIAVGFDGGTWFVFHLMIAGRLHWRDAGVALRRRYDLAALDFDAGSLVLSEAGTKRRASLHVLAGEEALSSLDPGGLDVMTASAGEFAERLARENHTLKRALTDPRILSGVGNAYSDEILHRARLSPVALTQRLAPDEVARLRGALIETLEQWTETLRGDVGEGFPENVTAFREGMAVHGRFGKPCPVCGSAVQRIRYASNETNYCPTCQTGGRLLADRVLSRLLRGDWPRTLEELEERRNR